MAKWKGSSTTIYKATSGRFISVQNPEPNGYFSLSPYSFLITVGKAASVKSGPPWNFPSTFRKNQHTRAELMLFAGVRSQRLRPGSCTRGKVLRPSADCTFNMISLCETSENNTNNNDNDNNTYYFLSIYNMPVVQRPFLFWLIDWLIDWCLPRDTLREVVLSPFSSWATDNNSYHWLQAQFAN